MNGLNFCKGKRIVLADEWKKQSKQEQTEVNIDFSCTHSLIFLLGASPLLDEEEEDEKVVEFASRFYSQRREVTWVHFFLWMTLLRT